MLDVYDLLVAGIVCATVVALFRLYLQSRNPKAFRNEETTERDIITGGLVMTAIGIASILGLSMFPAYSIWMIGGLIILFIGLALIAAYWLAWRK
jgi:hypothetical protein